MARVAAALDGREVEGDLLDRFGDGRRVEVVRLEAVGAQNGRFAVFEIDHAPRMRHERRRIARDHDFVLAQAEHHRAAVPSGQDEAGLARRDRGDAVRAFQQPQRAEEGGLEVVLLLEQFLNQVSDDLGIGLASEPVAMGIESARSAEWFR